MSGIWDGVFHLIFGQRGRAPPRAPVEPRSETIAPPVNVEAAPEANWTPAPAAPAPAAPESDAPAEEPPAQPEPVEASAPNEPSVADAAPPLDAPQPPAPSTDEEAPASAAPEPDQPAPDQPAPEPPLAAPAPVEHAAPEIGAAPIHADLQLTPHFKLGEFIASATASARGIDNTPPPEILEHIKIAAAGMEKVRALLGDKTISISSGFRCPDLNRAVGGSATSDHMGGFSVDFRCDGFGAPYAIVERLMSVPEFMAEVDQLIFEKSRWVHVSFAPRRKNEVLTAYEKPGEPKTYYAEGLKPLSGSYLA
jgi:zinc D-Ala-D-Ala carboxypeptidase